MWAVWGRNGGEMGLGDVVHQPRHAALRQLLDARAPQHVHVGLVRRAEVGEDHAAEACRDEPR